MRIDHISIQSIEQPLPQQQQLQKHFILTRVQDTMNAKNMNDVYANRKNNEKNGRDGKTKNERNESGNEKNGKEQDKQKEKNKKRIYKIEVDKKERNKKEKG